MDRPDLVRPVESIDAPRARQVLARNLALAREQLGTAPPQTVEPEQDSSSPRCPQCQIGFMIIIEWVDPRPIEGIDSS